MPKEKKSSVLESLGKYQHMARRFLENVPLLLYDVARTQLILFLRIHRHAITYETEVSRHAVIRSPKYHTTMITKSECLSYYNGMP